VLAVPALVGHCPAVLRIGEPMVSIAVIDDDDTVGSRKSTNIALVGVDDRVLEVGLAECGDAAADSVESNMHIGAPVSVFGLVLMRVGYATVVRYGEISQLFEIAFKKLTNIFERLGRRRSAQVDCMQS
jgi:hypothetical protein